MPTRYANPILASLEGQNILKIGHRSEDLALADLAPFFLAVVTEDYPAVVRVPLELSVGLDSGIEREVVFVEGM